MLDFNGPIHVTGPINITGPDHTAQLTRLELQLGQLSQLVQRGDAVMGQLQDKIDAIKAEVAEVHSVSQSASNLLDRLFALVQENIDDPAELQTVLDGLKAERESLAAAVTRNTPAEEPNDGGETDTEE